MGLQTSALFVMMLALSASLLGISLLVQVMQELYKFLTSSKSRAFRLALTDFAGPWVRQLYGRRGLPELQVRGPMQLWRSRPKGRLLPLARPQLTRAMEETAPPWIQRTLQVLKLENQLASPTSTDWSPNWRAFVSELNAAAVGSPGYSTAQDVISFLSTWGVTARSPGGLLLQSYHPPQELLVAFRQKFLLHIERVGEQYDQFLSNFEHAYRRRNLRQSFLFGLLITLAFNLPVQRLWQDARALSPEQAMDLAERAQALYEKAQAGSTKSAEVTKETMKRAEEIMKSAVVPSELSSYGPVVFQLPAKGLGASLRYLLGSLLTAILVSFGAPFWNDAVGALARLQKKPEPAAAPTET